jgi:hypothetical protein
MDEEVSDQPKDTPGVTIRAFTIEDREAACFARLHIQIEIEDDVPDPGSELDKPGQQQAG